MLFRIKYNYAWQKQNKKQQLSMPQMLIINSQLTKNSTESQSNITCTMPTDYFQKTHRIRYVDGKQ